MTNFRYMNGRFNVSYGLGVMVRYNEDMDPTKQVYPNYGEFEVLGHLGEDWGSSAQFTGYNFHHKLGLAFTMGSVMGMNCDLKGYDFYQNFMF